MGVRWGLLFGLACAGEPSDPILVRGGYVEVGPGGERRFVPLDWTAGARVRLGDREQVGPVRPACVPLFSVDLGDVSRQVALGAGAPDATVAWAPDGRLAVGTARGDVLVLDGWTGNVLARRALPEASARRLAWSADGRTLYVGEQSPDALLHALDADDLKSRWAFRFADRILSSPAPPGEDLYGVYTLPGVTAIEVLPGGDVLAAATHAWDRGAGRENLSQILRFSSSGSVVAAWPASPASATFLHLDVDARHDRVVVGVGRSAVGDPSADLPIDGAQVLDLQLRPQAAMVVPPLQPWFPRSFVWEGLAVSGRDVLIGFGDGRVRLFLDGRTLSLDPGAPVMAGEVPLVAPVGYAAFHPSYALVLTETTNIPWGAAAPDLRPPRPHPGADTLWAWTRAGEPAWSFTGPWAMQGLTVAGDVALVGFGPRSADSRRDLFGAALVDLRRDAPDRLIAVCATEAPAFFRHALHPDGRIALIEVPWAEGESVHGAWRVTVVR